MASPDENFFNIVPSAGQRQAMPPALRDAPLVTMGVAAGGFSTGAGAGVGAGALAALGGGTGTGTGTTDSAGLPATTTGVFVVVAGAGAAGGATSASVTLWNAGCAGGGIPCGALPLGGGATTTGA